MTTKKTQEKKHKKHKLLIKITDETVRNYYEQYKNAHDTDSGIDLVIPQDTKIPPFDEKNLFTEIDCGIVCEFIPNDGNVHGYFINARSSIRKTPLTLANIVGIMDFSYRGKVLLSVRNLSKNEYIIKKDTKLFQLLAYDLSPMRIKVVGSLSETERADGGFGSTDSKTNIPKDNSEKNNDNKKKSDTSKQNNNKKKDNTPNDAKKKDKK